VNRLLLTLLQIADQFDGERFLRFIRWKEKMTARIRTAILARIILAIHESR
jgi:hypothetical protein